MEEFRRRKPNRLKTYDYSKAGRYFITICSENRMKIFGSVETADGNANLALSAVGQTIENIISMIPKVYSGVEVDKYVIMPNHVHMIVTITSENDQNRPAPSVSRIVQQLKSAAVKQSGRAIWQKSFYDHIIRGEEDYRFMRESIETNPIRWNEDEYYV